ncbi:MAG: hypothetical protein ACRECX_03350 [Methyloceanibacter sp.]|uniref:hypothetical protein n=1 Tax=Methyloceanibacter sp. TaxID=1965321 RepID=UPI003D6C725E
MVKYTLAAALVLGFAGTAIAIENPKFVIVQDPNKQCRVIEKHTASDDELGMLIGKDGYPTRKEAEVHSQVICN